jgi:hypothetical protein
VRDVERVRRRLLYGRYRREAVLLSSLPWGRAAQVRLPSRSVFRSSVQEGLQCIRRIIRGRPLVAVAMAMAMAMAVAVTVTVTVTVVVCMPVVPGIWRTCCPIQLPVPIYP